MGEHSHDQHECFMPLSGVMSVEYQDVFTSAGPGKILYVPPKIEHRFSSQTDGLGERLIWLIDDKLWKKYIKEPIPITCTNSSQLIQELLFYLLLNKDSTQLKSFLESLMFTLKDLLTQTEHPNHGLDLRKLTVGVKDQRVKAAIDFLEKNLESSTLDVVAKRNAMSVRNFNRLFVKETNVTPKEFQQMLKINKACQLLKKTKMTVTDISLEVGYQSVSKFISTFKSFTGMLPTQFRQNEMTV